MHNNPLDHHLPHALLLGILLTLGACSDNDPVAPAPPRIALVSPVEPAEPASPPLRLAGVVQSVTSTQLAFQVPGRVARLHVEEGQRVQRGERLAELDSTDFRLQLREAEARRQQLQADLKRNRALLAEGILAPAAVEPIEANLIAAEVARDTARRNLAYSTLDAPFDGVIAQRLVEPDMIVGNGSPIFLLQDNGRVEVAVELPEHAALNLSLNATLEAEGELVEADVRLPLRYKSHSTQPREGARTYRLVLQGTPPPRYNLLPGMALRVALHLPQAETPATPHYRLPLSALHSDAQGQHYTWLADAGKARRHDLRLLSLAGDHAIVSGELPAQAKVIVAGGSKLADGMAIVTKQRD